jgi:hypothetical protein
LEPPAAVVIDLTLQLLGAFARGLLADPLAALGG